MREKIRTTPRSRWPETRSAIGTVGFSMFSTDSGMLVCMICSFGTFFSMWAASHILPRGPFFASTSCAECHKPFGVYKRRTDEEIQLCAACGRQGRWQQRVGNKGERGAKANMTGYLRVEHDSLLRTDSLGKMPPRALRTRATATLWWADCLPAQRAVLPATSRRQFSDVFFGVVPFQCTCTLHS